MEITLPRNWVNLNREVSLHDSEGHYFDEFTSLQKDNVDNVIVEKFLKFCKQHNLRSYYVIFRNLTNGEHLINWPSLSGELNPVKAIKINDLYIYDLNNRWMQFMLICEDGHHVDRSNIYAVKHPGKYYYQNKVFNVLDGDLIFRDNFLIRRVQYPFTSHEIIYPEEKTQFTGESDGIYLECEINRTIKLDIDIFLIEIKGIDYVISDCENPIITIDRMEQKFVNGIKQEESIFPRGIAGSVEPGCIFTFKGKNFTNTTNKKVTELRYVKHGNTIFIIGENLTLLLYETNEGLKKNIKPALN